MGRGVKVVIDPAQEEIICEKAKAGLGARGIAKLQLPELSGLHHQAIHKVIKKNGLCSETRTKAIKAGQEKMTPERREEILDFLEGPGKNLANTAAASFLQVSDETIGTLRNLANYGDSEREEYLQAVHWQRSISKKIGNNKKRVRLFLAMCWKQKKLEDEGYLGRRHKCAVCGRSWFRTTYFYFISPKRIIGWCKVCESEKNRLLYGGVKWKDVRAKIQKQFWIKGKFKKEALESAQLSVSSQKQTKECTGPCKESFFHSAERFHSVTVDGVEVVLDVCRECPM